MEEVWEDLGYAGLGIYKRPGCFTYGNDAVLLSNFIRIRPQERLLDLGAGTGIVALLAYARTGAGTYAVEIAPECCALMEKSLARNGLSEKIAIVQADLRSIPNERLPRESFDCVACNPPYHTGGTASPDPARRRSTHEEECTVFDVAACAFRMLKNGGRLFLCYPAAGLSRLCAALEGARLAVKRMTLVRAKRGKAPYLVLIEAKKGGGTGLLFGEDIILEES